MTSRIRDLTRTYDWYIYHGYINGKRTLQMESTTSRNGYNHKVCDYNRCSMWLFEVNVRLSEVTDLKWPHGTEWQCANSTLAMSWPNHVQILSFASMASRQVVVKHGFGSKIAGGFSSYDVIAPWPDLTWSFFYQKMRKVFPIRYPKTHFFRYLRKTSGGGSLSGRGLSDLTSSCIFPSLRAC